VRLFFDECVGKRMCPKRGFREISSRRKKNECNVTDSFG
jgi:hypothetical protein